MTFPQRSTLMHSRCFKAKRQAWVKAQQANCDHAEAQPYHRVCPACRFRFY